MTRIQEEEEEEVHLPVYGGAGGTGPIVSPNIGKPQFF